MKELAKKLLAVQKEMKAIVKDADNPFFKSKYFDINGLIDALKPVLNAHGVVVLQPLTVMQDGSTGLTTIVIESESGEKIEHTIPLPVITDVQKMGAAITYFRRYALTSLFLLEAEDDDGNATKGVKTVAKTKTTDPLVVVRTCPKCSKEHSGKYAKCMDCWKAEQTQ